MSHDNICHKTWGSSKPACTKKDQNKTSPDIRVKGMWWRILPTIKNIFLILKKLKHLIKLFLTALHESAVKCFVDDKKINQGYYTNRDLGAKILIVHFPELFRGEKEWVEYYSYIHKKKNSSAEDIFKYLSIPKNVQARMTNTRNCLSSHTLRNLKSWFQIFFLRFQTFFINGIWMFPEGKPYILHSCLLYFRFRDAQKKKRETFLVVKGDKVFYATNLHCLDQCAYRKLQTVRSLGQINDPLAKHLTFDTITLHN